MKIISIGSSKGCNIYIDAEDISKRHALIYVSSTGKMQIVDTSTNGTFINNIRVKPHTMMPVHRKDKVTFANGHQMDWSKIPNPMKRVYIVISLFLVCSLFCVISYYVYQKMNNIHNPISANIVKESGRSNSNNRQTEQNNLKGFEKKYNAKTDSIEIPSPEVLWLGSGNKLVVPNTTKKKKKNNLNNEIASLDTLNIQYLDTTIEEVPFIDLEVVEIETEDEESEYK